VAPEAQLRTGARARRWRFVRRLLAGLAGAAALAIAGLLLIPYGQRNDPGYRPRLAAPRHVAEHPAVCFDEGHYNAHTLGGRYRPLGRLLQADGYRVRRHRGRFTEGSLGPCDILVIANAAGGDRVRIGWLNLPIRRGGERNAPAFAAAETGLLRRWVNGGGNLLLVADHMPFGESARPLAAAFGVGMGGGDVEVPRTSPANGGPGQALFSRDNGLLRPHPITAGLGRVMTFTGQSQIGRAHV